MRTVSQALSRPKLSATQRQARHDGPRTVARVLNPTERAAKDSAREAASDGKKQARRDSSKTVSKVLTREERAAKDSAREAASDEKKQARRDSSKTVSKVLTREERAAKDSAREAQPDASPVDVPRQNKTAAVPSLRGTPTVYETPGLRLSQIGLAHELAALTVLSS